MGTLTGRRLEGLALLVITTIVWGSTFPLVRGVVAEVPPLQFVSWRFALAALCLVPWLRGGGGLRGALPGLGVGLANAAGFLLQTFALARTGADVVAFLTGLSVVLVPVGEALWRRRRPGALVVAALVAGVAGLALMTVRHGLALSSGVVLGAGCAVLFAVQVLGTGRLAARVGSIRLAAQEIVAGALAFPLVAVVWHPRWLLPPPAAVWPVLVYMGLVATVGTFLLQSAGQARVSATTAAITFNLEPVFAAAWTYVLTGAGLTALGWAGAALVLAGMAMAALAPGEADLTTGAQGALLPAAGGAGPSADPRPDG
jgi:drug/metabolite transporter (DMT)-like permease